MSKFARLEGQGIIVESAMGEIVEEGLFDKFKSIDWREKWEDVLDKLHKLIQWIIDKVKEFKNKLGVEKWKEVKVNVTLDIDWFKSGMNSKVAKYAEDIVTCQDDDKVREMGNRLTHPEGGNYPFNGTYINGWVKLDVVKTALFNIEGVATKVDQLVDICRSSERMAMKRAIDESKKSNMSHEFVTARQQMFFHMHKTSALRALLDIVNGDLGKINAIINSKEKK